MSFCFLILLTPKPSTTLLPYTTLFRSPRLLAIHSEVGAADVRNNHSRSGARRARRGRAAQGAVQIGRASCRERGWGEDHGGDRGQRGLVRLAAWGSGERTTVVRGGRGG